MVYTNLGWREVRNRAFVRAGWCTLTSDTEADNAVKNLMSRNGLLIAKDEDQAIVSRVSVFEELERLHIWF